MLGGSSCRVRLRLQSLLAAGLFLVFLASGCSGHSGSESGLPSNFKNLSTEDKMAYLMSNLTPDSAARYVCEASMGKIYNSRMELQQARNYVYENCSQEQIGQFESAIEAYEEELPLHERVRFSKLAAVENPDIYSYELGLQYVGSIREFNKSVEDVDQELGKLRKECQADPDFYRRFIIGFKKALELDHGRDLNEKIYQKFIHYSDNI